MDILPIDQPTYNITGQGQKVAFAAVAVNSAVVGSNQALLCASAACHFTIDGTAATANSTYLPANVFLAVNLNSALGPNTIISVIQDSAGGNLFITGLN